MYLAAFSLQVLKLKFSTQLSSLPCVLHVWTIYILFNLTIFCDTLQIMKLPSKQFPGLILIKESVTAKVVITIPKRRIWDLVLFRLHENCIVTGKVHIKFTAKNFIFFVLKSETVSGRIHRHKNIHSTANTRDASGRPLGVLLTNRAHDNASTYRCANNNNYYNTALYESVHNCSFPCLQKKRYKS